MLVFFFNMCVYLFKQVIEIDNFKMVDIEINAWSSFFFLISRLTKFCTYTTCILEGVKISTKQSRVSEAGKFKIVRTI